MALGFCFAVRHLFLNSMSHPSAAPPQASAGFGNPSRVVPGLFLQSTGQSVGLTSNLTFMNRRLFLRTLSVQLALVASTAGCLAAKQVETASKDNPRFLETAQGMN